ncbi:MAG: hypothetical protein FWG24_02325 [Eggerthellaceae bacterium]|nr:hypothetical protein [Eggerthellaceae bacterium]
MDIEDLSSEMQEKLQLILADSVKVVSFDIFETLLLRPVTHPNNIRQLVGKIAGVANFQDKRRLAESNTRFGLGYPTEECTLSEVYATYKKFFNCPKDEAERLMQTEMEVELSLLYPRKTVQFFYNEAKKAGKEIVITADTNLPADFIEKALVKNGYTGYSRLYLSCEYGRMKKTGNLYGCLISDFFERSIDAQEIVHIGDDSLLDVEKAQEAGIQAVYIRSALNTFIRFPELKKYYGKRGSLNNQFFIGLVANVMFDDPYRPFLKASRYNGEPELLGYLLAPFLISFLLWMAQEIKQGNIGQFTFLDRRGYLLQKMYKILKLEFTEPEIASFALSHSTQIAHYIQEETGLFDFLKDNPFNENTGLADFIIERLFANNEEEINEALNIFARKGYFNSNTPVGSLDSIAYFLYELEPCFKANLKKRIELCSENIQSNIDPSKNLGIFDVENKGSVSKFLNEQYGLASTYYHMFSVQTAELDNEEFESVTSKCFISESPSASKSFLIKGRTGATYSVRDLFFEDMVCEPLPRIKQTKQDDLSGTISEESAAEEAEPLFLMQGSVIEFTQLFADLLGGYLPYLEFDGFSLYNSIADLLDAPNKTDARLFSNFSYSDAGFSQDRKSLYMVWYKKHFPKASFESIQEQALQKNDGLSFKRRFKRRVRILTEKLHIYEQARYAYRQSRKLYYSVAKSESNRVLDDIRAQVNEGLQKLHEDTLIVRSNNILLVEGTHPAAYKAVSDISEAMPDYNWVYLTARRPQKKLSFAVYSIPTPLERGQFPKNSALSYTGEFLEQARNDEKIGKVVLERFRQSYPKMGSGYPEFFACEVVRYYEEALQRFAPQLVVVWNRNQGKSAIIDAIAHSMNIPTVYMESGELPGTLAIDEEGLFGESKVACNPKEFLTLPITWGERENAKEVIGYCHESGINRYAQKQEAGFFSALKQIDQRKPTIFFAGDFDVENGVYPRSEHSQKFYSPIFDSSDQTIEYLAKLAKQNNWNLIYKPHPHVVKSGVAAKKYPKNVICIDEGDINKLVDYADLTIVLTTSLAYTALIRGKPALSLGYTTLKDKGCSYEAFVLETIEPTVKAALEQGFTEEQREAFVRHTAQMNKYYLFDNQSNRPLRYGRTVEEAVQYLKEIMNKKEKKL